MTRRSSLVLFLAVVSCSDDTTVPAGPASTMTTLPQTGADVEAFIAGGSYKTWTSEPAVHDARSPSPHGFNRIYSSAEIATNATGSTPWPAGAAAVKELYASADGTTPVGYAYYVKTQTDSAGGASFYWYERVPLDSTAPHDPNGVVADGFGDSGPAQTICVACHTAAGSDADHLPSPNSHDFVYTPVH